MITLSPKQRRNLSRILPFGVIWFVTSQLFLLNDLTLSRNQNLNPETDITLSLPIIIFASIAITILGMIVGLLEMVFFEKRFSNYSLIGKISIKFLIYLLFFLLAIFITYPLASALKFGTNPFTQEIWNKMIRFLFSFTFLNTLLQLSFSLILSLGYAAISENLGHNVLKNFFTGKYHTPKAERRIFMFLDMKQSTTIAEQLGHVAYFNFLRRYYEVMSDSIVNYYGEVYQYVGDEVVITWKYDQGIEHQNCIRCFFDLKNRLSLHQNEFTEQFGIYPDFRAGMHVGEVTTGEIGALKKEIVYTGDVLNTAARLQNLCKQYETDLIFSQDLLDSFDKSEAINAVYLDEIVLRGKIKPTNFYTASGLKNH